jgi:hypothetical protein
MILKMVSACAMLELGLSRLAKDNIWLQDWEPLELIDAKWLQLLGGASMWI